MDRDLLACAKGAPRVCGDDPDDEGAPEVYNVVLPAYAGIILIYIILL